MSKNKKLVYRPLCVLISIMLILSVIACGNGDAGEPGAPEQLDAAGRLAEIENRLFIEYITGDSLSFHMFLKNPENLGLETPAPSWGQGYDREEFDESLGEIRDLLEELAEIDINELEEMEDIVLYRTLVQNLWTAVLMGDFYYFNEPFHTMNGLYAQAPLILAEFEFRRPEDIDIYITLLELYDEYIGRQIAYEREKADIGLFMPDFVLDMVIEVCEGFLADRDGQHYLVTSFQHRLDAAGWLDEAQRRQYMDENERVLREHFFPVYDSIIAELSLLRGRGSEEISGAQREHYLLLLASNTSSDFTPEYIIELLDDALDRTIFQLVGAMIQEPDTPNDYFSLAFSKGSVEENMDYLRSVGSSVFPAIPEHNLSLETLPPGLQFLNAAAYYLVQPVDDYYNNVIRINPSNAEHDPALMFILAHEGYGGHLLESVYSGSSGMGRLRRILDNVAFGEGFANYGAEQLLRATDFSKELVEYALAMNMLDHYLSARIEVGIFYEGWTEDDLADMLEETMGQRFDDEVTRDFYEAIYASKYVFIRYGVGTAFFQDLRERLETRLGRGFDPMAYHTLILDIGSSPLNIFAEILEEALWSWFIRPEDRPETAEAA